MPGCGATRIRDADPYAFGEHDLATHTCAGCGTQFESWVTDEEASNCDTRRPTADPLRYVSDRFVRPQLSRKNMRAGGALQERCAMKQMGLTRR